MKNIHLKGEDYPENHESKRINYLSDPKDIKRIKI